MGKNREIKGGDCLASAGPGLSRPASQEEREREREELKEANAFAGRTLVRVPSKRVPGRVYPIGVRVVCTWNPYGRGRWLARVHGPEGDGDVEVLGVRDRDVQMDRVPPRTDPMGLA